MLNPLDDKDSITGSTKIQKKLEFLMQITGILLSFQIQLNMMVYNIQL